MKRITRVEERDLSSRLAQYLSFKRRLHPRRPLVDCRDLHPHLRTVKFGVSRHKRILFANLIDGKQDYKTKRTRLIAQKQHWHLLRHFIAKVTVYRLLCAPDQPAFRDALGNPLRKKLIRVSRSTQAVHMITMTLIRIKFLLHILVPFCIMSLIYWLTLHYRR